MNTRTTYVIGILVVLVAGAWYFLSRAPQTQTPPQSLHTVTTADRALTFTIPSDFSLATSAEQVLVKAYIPPCEENFDYCLYYSGNAYQDTNFESAGLSIKKRTDLGSEHLCLDTPPDGFETLTHADQTTSTNAYSASVFLHVGDAAAGHVASGILNRLFIRNSSSCYEFLARIGETQFANFPPGVKKEFTDANRQSVALALQNILNSLVLQNGQRIVFPQAKSATTSVQLALLDVTGTTQGKSRGCDRVVLVPRDIPQTAAPLNGALQALFAEPSEKVGGLFNFIARTNTTLVFDHATVAGGIANIYLTGKLSGLAGVCDDPRAQIQIEETALQFPNVQKVQLYLNGTPTILTPSEKGQ